MSDLGDAVDAARVTPQAVESALLWRREGRSPTIGEARDYFDAHATGGGDAEVLEECERVLDAKGDRGKTPSPLPPPSEDQLEENGSD